MMMVRQISPDQAIAALPVGPADLAARSGEPRRIGPADLADNTSLRRPVDVRDVTGRTVEGDLSLELYWLDERRAGAREDHDRKEI